MSEAPSAPPAPAPAPAKAPVSPAPPAPSSATEPVPAAAPAPPAAKYDGKPFEDRMPANWHIEATEDEGVIVASNSSSGEKFSGTIAEFNQALRG